MQQDALATTRARFSFLYFCFPQSFCFFLTCAAVLLFNEQPCCNTGRMQIPQRLQVAAVQSLVAATNASMSFYPLCTEWVLLFLLLLHLRSTCPLGSQSFVETGNLLAPRQLPSRRERYAWSRFRLFLTTSADFRCCALFSCLHRKESLYCYL